LKYLLESKDKLEGRLNSEGYKTIYNWLRWLYLNFSVLFFMNIIIAIRAFYLGKLPEREYFFAVSIILLILNIRLYQYPTILYGIKSVKNDAQTMHSFVHKQQKKLYFDDHFITKFQQILTDITTSNQIIHPDFSAQRMAILLDISPHLLNRYLKEELKTNFSQLVNRSRIQILLTSVKPGDLSKYSVIGLIKTYGFSSINQFKKDLEKYSSEDYESFILKMKTND
jgi:YesN/AraC family two-component response regulator